MTTQLDAGDVFPVLQAPFHLKAGRPEADRPGTDRAGAAMSVPTPPFKRGR